MSAVRTSRRQALAFLTLGLGGLYLAACSSAAPTPPATTAAPPASASPTAQPRASATRLSGADVRIGILLTSTGPVAEAGRKNLVTLKLIEGEINAAGGVK